MEMECEVCGGDGEAMHPRWGSRNCPAPTITCPACGGSGMVEAYLEDGELVPVDPYPY